MLTGLVRFAFSMVMLLTFVWFAVTVPLGKRTLWGHVQAIFGTQEAKDLAEGTKEEAEKVARKVKAELHPGDMAHADARAPAPSESHAETSQPHAQTSQPHAPSQPHAQTSQPRHVKTPLPAR